MDRFESMSAFVAVVETGSFTAAAKKLAMPLATVSRKVSELEDHLRVQLLTRTTRQVATTESGQHYYETARRVLDELIEAERQAAGEYKSPRGDLVVSAPFVLGRSILTPLIVEFLAVYPEVDIDLRLTDRTVSLAEEQVDVAVRIGDLPDSALMAVKIGTIRRVTCGSPAYLDRSGVPETLDDLGRHTCVTLTSLEAAKEWTFRSGGGVVRYPVRSRLAVSSAEAAAEAAAAGVGLTRLLCYQVSDLIDVGRLRLVLRDQEPEPHPVHLVYARGRIVPQKLRAFVDFIAPRLKALLVFRH